MVSPRIAIVTGAGTGIGRAAALALMKAGFTVVLAGRRKDKLEEVAKEGAAKGGKSLVGSGRHRRPGLDQGAVRQDQGGVRPARCAVQQCRRRRAGGADRGPAAREMEGGRRHQPHRHLPVHAGSDPHHEGPDAARRAHHQQRLDLRPYAAARSPIAYTATKHAITGLTKSTALDGRAYDIACGQIDIGNAVSPLTERMVEGGGILQPNGQKMVEPRMDVEHVGDAVAYMAGLPLASNVLFMTVMATKMPFVGRG